MHKTQLIQQQIILLKTKHRILKLAKQKNRPKDDFFTIENYQY